MPEEIMTAIAKLAESLGEVKGILYSAVDLQKRDTLQATESRKDLYQAVTDVKIAQAGTMRDIASLREDVRVIIPNLDNVERDVRVLINDVATMKPDVKDMKETYTQGKGVVWATRAGWTVLIGFLGWLVATLLPLWQGRPGGH